MFKLGKKTETFEDIKISIASYFGLPLDKIFLTNQKKDMLLSNQTVVDELFPLQSTKIKNEKPIVFVTFQKNMSTLDYILGDPMQKKAEMEAENARRKEEYELNEK